MDQISLADDMGFSHYPRFQNKTNCVPYCRLEDKKYQQKEVLEQLCGQIETLFENKDRGSKIRPLVQRYNQGLDALDKLTDHKANFLMPTAMESLRKRHREAQMQGLRAVNDWMRWLQETKEEETLTGALVTGPMGSSEALLHTKMSVAIQNHEILLMMNSHGNTEQAPIATECNIDHTNQQEVQTTDSGNPNAASVSVLSSQIHDHLSNEAKNTLDSLGKRPNSNPSSRSSSKRLEVEAEFLRDEAGAKVAKNRWKQSSDANRGS